VVHVRRARAPAEPDADETYEDYLRRRDPELGWPLPEQMGSALFTASGARPSPAFPDTTPETSEIALYGDSFTQSPNSDAETWGNVLAELSKRRVSNYGQGGYGTDQAFLRFRRNANDRSKFVILAQVAEDIVRNLTRYRDLVTYEMWYAYKPRFVLDAKGELRLVPIPKLSEAEHRRLIGLEEPRSSSRTRASGRADRPARRSSASLSPRRSSGTSATTA
jgi:hypothetical protein